MGSQPGAHRHGQVQRGVAVLASGVGVGPVGQQHHDTVEAVAHDGHVQGCVPCRAGAIYVATPFQQQAGHLWRQESQPRSAGWPEWLWPVAPDGTWAQSLPQVLGLWKAPGTGRAQVAGGPRPCLPHPSGTRGQKAKDVAT